MALLNPELGRILTCAGAAAEAIGLPLAILDYRWPLKAQNLQKAVSTFATTGFKTLWNQIVAVYSGGVAGNLTPAGALLGGIGAGAGIRAGFLARHAGSGWLGTIGIGVGVLFAADLVLAFGVPLPVIAFSRLIRPLNSLSHNHPVGLFGVILACIGFLVSLYHVLEIIIG